MAFATATVLAAAAVAASVAGTYVAYQASQQQAAAQQASLRYQAQVASNNSAIAQQEEASNNQSEATAEQNQRQQTAGLLAKQRAIEGASGIDANSGSPLDVQESTARLGEMDALTIKSNYARQNYNYEVAGMSDTAQSSLDMLGASAAGSAGNLAGWSSIVGGAASVGNKWLGYMQAGVPGFGGAPNPAFE